MVGSHPEKGSNLPPSTQENKKQKKKEKRMKYSEQSILAAARRFLENIFGKDIPQKVFWGAKLGLGIARELGVKVSKTPEGLDRAISALELKECRRSQTLQGRVNLANLSPEKVAVDFQGEEKIEVDEHFLHFLATGTTRLTRPNYSLEKVTMEMFPREFWENDLYLDCIQVKTIEKFTSAQRTNQGALIDLEWIKVLVPDCGGADVFELVGRLLSASKTQKRNMIAFSRGEILRGKAIRVAALLSTHKEEVSKDVLTLLRDLCEDTQRASTLSISAGIAYSRRMPFAEWVKIVVFAKRHKYEVVWNLISIGSYDSFESFKRRAEDVVEVMLEKEAARKKKIAWPQIVPEIKSERFVIKQIMNLCEIEEEGEEQRHCVANYYNDCEKGKAIVLSVVVTGEKKRYTVLFQKEHLYKGTSQEPKENFRLTQFKGKFNSQPSEDDYWEVLQIIEQNSSMISANLILPPPGSGMVY
jgi:hypothetical protein